MIIRAVVVALALTVCAWFALGVRQAHDTARATSILARSSSLSQTQARRAMSLLSAAGELNPDTNVNLLRAQLDAELGERQAAVQILQKLARSEPQNAAIWDQLARTATTNPRVVVEAERHLAELISPG